MRIHETTFGAVLDLDKLSAVNVDEKFDGDRWEVELQVVVDKQKLTIAREDYINEIESLGKVRKVMEAYANEIKRAWLKQ